MRGWRGKGGGARVSAVFFTKNLNIKQKANFGGGGAGAGVWGLGYWMEGTGVNIFFLL